MSAVGPLSLFPCPHSLSLGGVWGFLLLLVTETQTLPGLQSLTVAC